MAFPSPFRNEWYALLRAPGGETEVAFLLPDLPEQHPMFRNAFTGEGVFLTLEVDDVDALYDALRGRGVEIAQEMKDEIWGDRHFSVLDPNGVGLDFVRYTPPA